ncbi:MAG: 1,4-alpha-glucan branching protein GlgB [Rhodospirillales bacterium]|nr:1,4-alpha-glucan branching protein GlgB [Rhodospirillales bacterium]
MGENEHQAGLAAIVNADHGDPFGYLGMHGDGPGGCLTVRAYLPQAGEVDVVDRRTGKTVARMQRIHETGLFAATLKRRKKLFDYRLRLRVGAHQWEIDDPYRFPPVLGEMDIYLLAEGTDLSTYRKLGAHPRNHCLVDGVHFAVWAPNAKRVSVVGDFNDWDGRRHPMRLHPGCGVWEIFLPGIEAGSTYKFEIKGRDGRVLDLKADPYAFQSETPPKTASVVHGLGAFQWQDGEWMKERAAANRREAPISIYEVHLASWQRVPEEGFRSLSYRELEERLIPYVKEMGFTHLELLPISEYPFDGSWGYQPISLFAPTSRLGGPDDFRSFIDACHRAGIGVIIDWVAAHFPEDAHGLVRFDGTHLYEHADPRRGRHMDWGTLIYNYGRTEVSNFLIANALFWLEEFHIDGLRVDAVASMLYLDYSREEGEWVPNVHGGNENIEAVQFLKRLNEQVYANFPDVMTMAEESTSWPMVSRPTEAGGLGFGFKWNMGWMHDTLHFMARDPVHRTYHLNDLTFGLLYAFQENFVLPLSHDEVVHGKRSILGRMPGDDWQRFANLRAYYTFMFTYPGKKLLFMGNEFAQGNEWNHDSSLDWHLTEFESHAGIRRLIRDLNHLYRDYPTLHERDCEPEGFQWIDCQDTEQGVISYARRGATPGDVVVVVSNFTPVVRHQYRVGVPQEGWYAEELNSDSSYYGGSNVGNFGGVESEAHSWHGQAHSVVISLPPLAAIVFRRTTGQ